MLTSSKARARFTLAALTVLLALVVACTDDDPAPGGGNETPTGTPPAAATATPPDATGGSAPEANLRDGCIENYEDGVDYFPEKLDTAFAENFTVEYNDSYKVVTALEPFPGGPAEQYVLVQCGAPMPELTGDLSGAPVVEVPVTSLFAGSTTHLPLLVDLGREEVLTGVPEAAFINSPSIRAMIDAGDVIEYALNFQIDTELVIASEPSVLMTGGFDEPAFTTLRGAGVTVIANAEWLEDDALARAEWLKYMALFLNEEAAATAVFDEIAEAYLDLAAEVASVAEGERPTVMTGNVFNGVFYTAGGQSSVARLIDDAGAAYVWADNDNSGTLELDLEQQLDRAGDAEFWINGGVWNSLDDVLAEDSRHAEFRAFQEGQIWLYDRIVNEFGGNDYWERGVTRPDLLLADLVKIFHPDLVPDHEFVWYRQLTD